MRLSFLYPLMATVCAAQPLATPAGAWHGAIDIPGVALQIEVVLHATPAWSGQISIPAQGMKNYALAEVKVEGAEVAFSLPGIPSDPRFKGQLGLGVLDGTFTQGGRTFPFRLQRGPAPVVAQPALPAGLTEREVSVGQAPWLLPGTLTLPAGKGPWPSVVLVHGSGPNDRNETIGPNAPFRDLAWGLAQRGIAVLRYEKRTKAHAAALVKERTTLTTWQETVLDAADAARLLQGMAGLDPRRVFVLGHSLGGYLLPRVGQRVPFVAGLISLAGPARPMEDLLVEQMAYLGAPEQIQAESRAQAARIKALEPGKDPGGPLPFGSQPAYWLDLKGYDPVQAVRALPQPLLILQGDLDAQVRAADFQLWSKGLEGRGNVKFRRFETLNHLFMPGSGQVPAADYQKPGHVDEAVLAEISGWIHGLAPARP